MDYTSPDWAGTPRNEFYFEIIKDGRVLEVSETFKSSVVTVGRADCQIKMEHSSISRYHALIQFKNDGSKYLYDLGSTHGTFLNKQRISPRTYCKLKVGDLIKFGASSRMYFFQGEKEEPKIQESGISWGFRQDAYVGDEWEGKDLQLGAIDRSSIPKDSFYLKDPRSVLQSWLEGRGEELRVQTSQDEDDEVSFISKIVLPITTVKGDLIAIGFGRNKKKAERDACLEACAKLDKLEILRGSESSRRPVPLEEFGDDTDTFFDRTKKSKPVHTEEPEKIETYDSLLDQKMELEDSIRMVRDEILQKNEAIANMEASDDDLEAFMQDVQKNIMIQEQKALDLQLEDALKVLNLIQKMTRIETLIQLAKPSSQSIIDDINKKRELKSKADQAQSKTAQQTKAEQTKSKIEPEIPVQIIRDTTEEEQNESIPQKQVFGAKRKYDDIEDDYVDGIIGDKQSKEAVARIAKSYGY